MAPETTLRTGSQKGERSFIHTCCKSFVMEALCTCRKTKSVSSSPLCDRVGASEISDACKPLKKRSRASTDVEMASSQYRDTSDSDSRGLNDPQVALNDMTEGFFLHTKYLSPLVQRLNIHTLLPCMQRCLLFIVQNLISVMFSLSLIHFVLIALIYFYSCKQ